MRTLIPFLQSLCLSRFFGPSSSPGAPPLLTFCCFNRNASPQCSSWRRHPTPESSVEPFARSSQPTCLGALGAFSVPACLQLLWLPQSLSAFCALISLPPTTPQNITVFWLSRELSSILFYPREDLSISMCSCRPIGPWDFGSLYFSCPSPFVLGSAQTK